MSEQKKEYTEKQLKLACLDGQLKAQRHLYELLLPYVYTICRKYFIPTAYQKDMIQDIFSEVFMKLDRFNPEKGVLKTWVRHISIYRIIDYKRKNGKMQILEISPDFHESTAPEIWKKLYLEDFLKLTKDMPEGYRTIFFLTQSEGYSHEESGELLGISAQTSRSQLSRAKNWLRKNLQPEYIK